MSLHAIVLAAGKGTRMSSDLAKVLHDVNGRSLLACVLGGLATVELDQVVVVVGYQADQVIATLPSGIGSALQVQQLGTGHATEVGLNALSVEAGDTVLVLPGDMPLLQPATIEALISVHVAEANAATMLTAILEDPTGYGRVLRGSDGVEAIVEDRDATDAQRAITEVNTSVYSFDAGALEKSLGSVTDDNDQGERYLTDVIAILREEGHRVGALVAAASEGVGVNDDDQLAAAAALLRDRGAA